jgi:hypothetical protein
MALADVLFGKSDDVREAERNRRKAEDEMMALDQRELGECPIHAQKDVQRMGVILANQRLGVARQTQDSKRNMLTTLGSGALVVAVIKGGPIWEWLAKALGFL